MTAITPRVVFVTRETDYELLIARHATRDQARFFLETRGQKIVDLEARQAQYDETLRRARASVSADWRQTLVKRTDFDRFLFAPEDIIVAVGQDGLVANVAKYLDGQRVLGVNPAPDQYDGVLVRLNVDALAGSLPAALHSDIATEHRTMVEATTDSGERLLALNEIFVGHRSHQSARYTIATDNVEESQSSSGLIVASGTGATGWARSIMEASGNRFLLDPEERAIAYFVREPFPSISTGTNIKAGKLSDGSLLVTSRMNDGGTIFADGMEQDFLRFDWGQRVSIEASNRTLHLVGPMVH
jgi:NAD kinase